MPIVPGTRVTEAEARPPVPARPASLAAPPAPVAPVAPVAQAVPAATAAPAADDVREVPGQVSATEDRARTDALKALQAKVAKWLEPDVPASWTPPAALLQAMVIETRTDPHISQDPYINQLEQEDGPLYTAVLTADFSPGAAPSWSTPTTATWSGTAC